VVVTPTPGGARLDRYGRVGDLGRLVYDEIDWFRAHAVAHHVPVQVEATCGEAPHAARRRYERGGVVLTFDRSP